MSLLKNVSWKEETKVDHPIILRIWTVIIVLLEQIRVFYFGAKESNPESSKGIPLRVQEKVNSHPSNIFIEAFHSVFEPK
jgi:hypothetical protein